MRNLILNEWGRAPSELPFQLLSTAQRLPVLSVSSHTRLDLTPPTSSSGGCSLDSQAPPPMLCSEFVRGVTRAECGRLLV